MSEKECIENYAESLYIFSTFNRFKQYILNPQTGLLCY